MRHASVFALLLLLLAVGAAQADDEPKMTGEIRIYLADSKKNPATLEGIRARALVEPKGGQRKLYECKVVRPKGNKKTGIGHGGEVRSMEGGYLVDPQTSETIRSVLNSTASIRAIANVVAVEATSTLSS